MLTVESRIPVVGLTGQEVSTFLLDPADVRCRAGQSGAELQFHPLAAAGVDHVGDVVLMDEVIGSRRVRMAAIVEEAEPGKKVMWQLSKGIRLPVRLTLELTDRDHGVAIRHTITVGWKGLG